MLSFMTSFMMTTKWATDQSTIRTWPCMNIVIFTHNLGNWLIGQCDEGQQSSAHGDEGGTKCATSGLVACLDGRVVEGVTAETRHAKGDDIVCDLLVELGIVAFHVSHTAVSLDLNHD